MKKSNSAIYEYKGFRIEKDKKGWYCDNYHGTSLPAQTLREAKLKIDELCKCSHTGEICIRDFRPLTEQLTLWSYYQTHGWNLVRLECVQCGFSTPEELIVHQKNLIYLMNSPILNHPSAIRELKEILTEKNPQEVVDKNLNIMNAFFKLT